jgi:hypothetical protein
MSSLNFQIISIKTTSGAKCPNVKIDFGSRRERTERRERRESRVKF